MVVHVPLPPSPDGDQLPPAHPDAMKALSKSRDGSNKSGLNRLLADTLLTTSFTILGADSELNWALAQVGSFSKHPLPPPPFSHSLTPAHSLHGGGCVCLSLRLSLH